MSWLEHLSEPLASTREEAARYIAEQLEQAVPEGWMVRYMGDHALAWTIAKVNIQPGEWPDKEYGVHLSRGLDSLSFTHGNKDNGPLSLHHVLLRSLVIDAASLRHFGMAACLEHLFSHYEPNEWGYT